MNLNKQLRVTFTLANNNAVFPGTSANVLTLTGLRMSAMIVGGGAPAWPSATVKIFGMAQQDMNALAVQVVDYGKTGYLPNSILVEANSGGGWSAVFAGNIITAAPDYSSMPDVPLVVTSMTGVYDSVNPATPSSFPGSTDIADVLSVICAKLSGGVAFVNNGVTGVTGGATYYPTATTEQLRSVCDAYNLDPVFSNDGHLVVVSPRGAADSSPSTILSPQNGLIGYPTPQANGLLSVRALYNPAWHVKSSITIQGSDAVIDNNGVPTTLNASANGNWFVCSITNTLESLMPNGAWFSDMLLCPPPLQADLT